ncbi:hypothetical protein [Phenylobacterium sp.]
MTAPAVLVIGVSGAGKSTAGVVAALRARSVSLAPHAGGAP